MQSIVSHHQVIDVHAHVTPPRYLVEVANRMQGPLRSWSVEKHLEDMELGGVDLSILSLSNPGVSVGEAETGRRLARDANAYMADLAAQSKGRLGAFTCLPLPDIDVSLKEVERGLDQYGHLGIGLFTNYGGKWLGDPHFDPLFEELNRRRALVYVHPIAGPCCSGLLPYLMDAAIEFGTDTTRAIVNYVYRGAARRFPNVTMIWSHAGGTMPFLIERFDFYQKTLLDPKLRENFPGGFRAEAEKFLYDTAQTANSIAMTALKQLVPITQIVFGSDFPFRTTGETLNGLRNAGTFDVRELQRICWDNMASRLVSVRGLCESFESVGGR